MAMPDEEIIKALECCMNEDGNTTCRDCPLCNCSMDCFSINSKNALDLIKRKDAEIERLKNIDIQMEVSDRLEKQIKSEAIKEFAERLKKQIGYEASPMVGVYLKNMVDNLVKEMVGD